MEDLKSFGLVVYLLGGSEVTVPTTKPKNDPLGFILNTVQDIPENIGRAFRDAERFTRDNVLPIVNSLTPKFITNIFAPKELPRFIPFTSEESTWEFPFKLPGITRNKRNKKVSYVDDKLAGEVEVTVGTTIAVETTTAYSNIQKIPIKKIK